MERIKIFTSLSILSPTRFHLGHVVGNMMWFLTASFMQTPAKTSFKPRVDSERIMSALCLGVALRLLLIVSIFVSTTLCSNVVWKNRGDSITIQCRFKGEDANLLSLKKGLRKEEDIFYKSKNSDKITLAEANRTEIYDKFPNVDILLKNLDKTDTGVYWCMYNKIDKMRPTDVEGEGSVLLIVTEKVSGSAGDSKKGASEIIAEVDKSTAAGEPCSRPNHDLFVTSVVISAVVLTTIFIAVLLLVIRKVKCLRENKPSPVPLNDVYEDMRATIRR